MDGQVISDMERDDLHREVYRTQGKLTSCFGYDAMGRKAWQYASTLPADKLSQVHNVGIQPALYAEHAYNSIHRRYEYDPAGKLVRTLDKLRGEIMYEYEANGQSRSRNTGSITTRESFRYDPAANQLDFNARQFDIPDELDFSLPKLMPIEWTRFYASDLTVDSVLGRGWVLPWEQSLRRQDRFIYLSDNQGREVPFVALQPGERIYNPHEQVYLVCTEGGHYILQTLDNLFFYFGEVPDTNTNVPLERIENALGNFLHFTRTVRWHVDQNQRHGRYSRAPALRSSSEAPDRHQARGEQSVGRNAHPLPLRRTQLAQRRGQPQRR